MSTKRMSKTVIEGGRGTRNKFERYQSNAEVRAAQRDYLKEVMADPEFAYEDEIPERQTVYKDFRDKLRPHHRWAPHPLRSLAARGGRFRKRFR